VCARGAVVALPAFDLAEVAEHLREFEGPVNLAQEP
jgi:hypothetical protein